MTVTIFHEQPANVVAKHLLENPTTCLQSAKIDMVQMASLLGYTCLSQLSEEFFRRTKSHPVLQQLQKCQTNDVVLFDLTDALTLRLVQEQNSDCVIVGNPPKDLDTVVVAHKHVGQDNVREFLKLVSKYYDVGNKQIAFELMMMTLSRLADPKELMQALMSPPTQN